MQFGLDEFVDGDLIVNDDPNTPRNVRIRATLMENGSPRTIQHPMHLVRAEDGTWQVFDY